MANCCPHCDYVFKQYTDNGCLFSEEGEFYTTEIVMTARSPRFVDRLNTKQLYGCPKCDKVFMDY
jgi:hypothetical protein